MPQIVISYRRSDSIDITGRILDRLRAHFGEDAWNKLYQARLARHRNIVIREFTRRLPNISEQEKNGLFDAFSRSDAFGVIEHNALLDALADPVKGWNLNEY